MITWKWRLIIIGLVLLLSVCAARAATLHAPGGRSAGAGNWASISANPSGIVLEIPNDGPLQSGPSGQNALWLGIAAESVYVRPGDACVVTLNQGGLAVLVVGYQAFLQYDVSKLAISTGQIAFEPTPYGLPILKHIQGSEIDLACGINQVAGQTPTSVDAVLATMSFTVPVGTPDGTTAVGFRTHDPATIFTDADGVEVAPLLVESPTIYIDGTPPTGLSVTADPSSWTNSSTITFQFSATDALSGIDRYELALDGGTYSTKTSPCTVNVSALAGGVHTATVKAIDRAGNESTASTSFYLDRGGPTVTIESCKQGGVELIGGPNAVQGVVDIYVRATDNFSGVNGHPAVTVTPHLAAAQQAVYVDQAGDVFHYTWTVTPSTANGAATVNAEAYDMVGNRGQAAPRSFNVNKSRAIITLELEGVFEPAVTRTVKLVIGGTGGTVLPLTLFKQVSFTSDGSFPARGSVTLTDFSTDASWTKISAKDEQHTLRRTVDLINTGNYQFTADFTGPKNLAGGDFTNDNVVDIRDFGVFTGQFGQNRPLDTLWPTRNADASCNGYVHTEDFSFIQIHFLLNGDPLPGSAPETGSSEDAASALASISTADMVQAAGAQAAISADVNSDGVVDSTDVGLFIQRSISVKRGR